MKKIITSDNTETFLNEQIGECYHSQSGAIEEALRKYIIPCRIKELAEKGSIRILDVCFGLGYNSAMAVDIALLKNPLCKIKVIGLENDPEIIRKIQEVNPPIKFYSNYKQLTPEQLYFKHRNVSVRVDLRDAREAVKSLADEHFDAVFFDPFSPKKMPEMWSAEFFSHIARIMKSTGILATYSCARLARENMAKAGLFYDQGPIVGRRGPGTIATKWD